MDRTDEAPESREAKLLVALRRAFQMHEMSPEEAQALYDDAEPVRLTDEQVQELVMNAISPTQTPTVEDQVSFKKSEVHDQVLVLNRNKKDDKPGVRDLVERQKAEALDDVRKRQEQAGPSREDASGESGSPNGSGDSRDDRQ